MTGSGNIVAQYIEMHRKTNRFPADSISFAGLGIAGELSEFLEKNITRKESEYVYEFGDILYYQVAAIVFCSDYEIATYSLSKAFSSYRNIVVPLDVMMYNQLYVCELIKKLMRNPDDVLLKELIIRTAEDAIRALFAYADGFDIPPVDIMVLNIRKLLKRLEKGMINGFGDHREREEKK